MLERGPGGAGTSCLRSIPEDKAFLQSPRPSVEGLSAPLRHALQNSLVRTALKNGALICTWCGPGLATPRPAARTRRGAIRTRSCSLRGGCGRAWPHARRPAASCGPPAALALLDQPRADLTQVSRNLRLTPPRRYFFSTLLSLWNRTLLGKSHGIFGMGAFPGATALALCAALRSALCRSRRAL